MSMKFDMQEDKVMLLLYFKFSCLNVQNSQMNSEFLKVSNTGHLLKIIVATSAVFTIESHDCSHNCHFGGVLECPVIEVQPSHTDT